ncbi:hypothetical protein IG631_17594 [Alternaria alternata]|nr:hypothetical protein IG631_17594 [Alternaria alternata]
MRLLNTKTRELLNAEPDYPKYAVLSHTWDSDEYVYKDLVERNPISKKLQMFCGKSEQMGYQYCWADTCCVDQTSRSEVNEATVSMYSWFKNTKMSCVYLSDVDGSMESCANARWFTRSWALVELLAPEPDRMFFYDRNWELIGSKEDLSETISKVTGVPVDVLTRQRDPMSATIGEKLSWASNKGASKQEDHIYALISLLGLPMDMRPGEGKAAATMRMQKHILGNLEDYTVLMLKRPLGLAHRPPEEIKDPELQMEQPDWSQLDLHSPIDLISTKTLSKYVPKLRKPPDSPQLTGRGLRVTLLAKKVDSYIIAWTYCTQVRSGKVYAVCIRVVPDDPASDTQNAYFKGKTNGLVCYVSEDRLRSFQYKDVYFDIKPDAQSAFLENKAT